MSKLRIEVNLPNPAIPAWVDLRSAIGSSSLHSWGHWQNCRFNPNGRNFGFRGMLCDGCYVCWILVQFWMWWDQKSMTHHVDQRKRQNRAANKCYWLWLYYTIFFFAGQSMFWSHLDLTYLLFGTEDSPMQRIETRYWQGFPIAHRSYEDTFPRSYELQTNPHKCFL